MNQELADKVVAAEAEHSAVIEKKWEIRREWLRSLREGDVIAYDHQKFVVLKVPEDVTYVYTESLMFTIAPYGVKSLAGLEKNGQIITPWTAKLEQDLQNELCRERINKAMHRATSEQLLAIQEILGTVPPTDQPSTT
jgi:hypothetical protein